MIFKRIYFGIERRESFSGKMQLKAGGHYKKYLRRP
jgi:hypothetical protein